MGVCRLRAATIARAMRERDASLAATTRHADMRGRLAVAHASSERDAGDASR